MCRRTLRPLFVVLAFLLLPCPAHADDWVASFHQDGLPSHLVGVDKGRQTFIFFEKKSPLKVKYTFPCATGQLAGDKRQTNDLRTPEGVYFVEYKIASGLDFKEYGGIAYTLNYPNPVDRLRGKTGYGIWIHSKGVELVPRGTKGCIALGLEEIGLVGPSLTPGTAVVLAETLDAPKSSPQSGTTARELRRLMRQWSDAWASRSKKMFDYYDPEAWDKSMPESFTAFRQNKERLFSILRFIKIFNREIHALEGPGYWVTWAEQFYQASNLSTEGVRRLYWQQGKDKKYRIVGMDWIPRDLGMRADFRKGRLVTDSNLVVTDAEAPLLPKLDMPEMAPETAAVEATPPRTVPLVTPVPQTASVPVATPAPQTAPPAMSPVQTAPVPMPMPPAQTALPLTADATGVPTNSSASQVSAGGKILAFGDKKPNADGASSGKIRWEIGRADADADAAPPAGPSPLVLPPVDSPPIEAIHGGKKSSAKAARPDGNGQDEAMPSRAATRKGKVFDKPEEPPKAPNQPDDAGTEPSKDVAARKGKVFDGTDAPAKEPPAASKDPKASNAPDAAAAEPAGDIAAGNRKGYGGSDDDEGRPSTGADRKRNAANGAVKEPEGAAQVREELRTWMSQLAARSPEIVSLYARDQFGRTPKSTSKSAYSAEMKGLEKLRDAPWIKVMDRNIRIVADDGALRSSHDELVAIPGKVMQGVRTLWWRQDQAGNYKIVASEFVPGDHGLAEEYLDSVSAEVSALLDRWRVAWERADIDGYMACYDDRARQQGRSGAANIRSQKEKLWKKVKPVKVRLSGRRLMLDDKGIVADMQQEYQDTSGRKDSGTKTLQLRYDGQRWSIVREEWSSQDAEDVGKETGN
ncbi:MAG: L,D-transpeptidase family protein [Desulfovibrio sp.]|jgi:murein L,D-transpeptidase YafK|nr:L,D-transpeptidase family protein [Desulfovibrio sp.]